MEYVTVLQPYRTAAMGNLAAMQDMTEPVYRTKGLAELKDLMTMFHKQKESFQAIPRVQVPLGPPPHAGQRLWLCHRGFTFVVCVCGGGWWNAVDALVWGLFVAHVSLVFLFAQGAAREEAEPLADVFPVCFAYAPPRAYPCAGCWYHSCEQRGGP